MKKLIIIVLMLGTLQAEIPQYNGPTLEEDLCAMNVEIFQGTEKRFIEMIRSGRITEAQSAAIYIVRYYDRINEKVTRVSHYCKQAMTKEEYRNWFLYVKRKRDELEKKGWLK